MAEPRLVTAAEIDKRLRARGAALEPPLAPPPKPARLEYRAAVALLSWFDVASIEAALGPLDDPAVRAMLTADCERISTPHGSRWRLRADVRELTVRQLGTPAAVLRALGTLPPDPADVARIMTEAVLRGTAPALSRQTVAQLYGTLHAVEMLAPLNIALPDTDEIRKGLGVAGLLDPLRLLVRPRFIGRERELRILEDYVYAPQGTAPGRPQLVIHGPGGVGKSTLVAHFVLDHVDRSNGRMAMAYLSFDRSDLAADQPLTLLAEAIRQLRMLHPAVEADADLLEKSVRSTLRRLTAGERSRMATSKPAGPHATGTERDELVLLERFTRLVDSLAPADGGPLLWVLDTMEQVQRRGPHSMDRLWRFLDNLQAIHPHLRVVFAGRAPLEGHPIRSLPLEGFADEQALAFLRHIVGPGRIDDAFLREVIRQVSTNPLSLKLAGELLRKEGEPGVRQLGEQRVVLAMLGAEEVQGVLYRRVLDRLENPDLRLIANPGLVVRRVTPSVIAHVLAEPCGLGEVGTMRSWELFDALREEASLVEAVPGEEAVVHRADVRRTMLRLLRRDDPAAVAMIHRKAIEYYATRSGQQARAEELYHRLALGEPAIVLDQRWDPRIGSLLESALDELPAASRAYLANQLDIPVDPDTLREAESEVWASQAIRVGRDLIDAGQAPMAVNVLLERSTNRIDVITVAVEALASAGRLTEALALVKEALHNPSARSGPESLIELSLIELLTLGARIAEDAETYDDALRWLQQARALAETASLTVHSLTAGVAEARIYRRSQRSDSPEASALRTWLIEASDRFSRPERHRHPALVRDLAAEVGKDVHSLVVDAARLHGVDIEGAAGAVLTDHLGGDTVRDVASSAARTVVQARGEPQRATSPRTWPGQVHLDTDTDTDAEAWPGPTSTEAGIGISNYLSAEPDRVARWAGVLSDAYKAEADQATYGHEGDKGSADKGSGDGGSAGC